MARSLLRVSDPPVLTPRLRRIADELAEQVAGLEGLLDSPTLLAELDYALRPAIHERRVPSFGALHDPTTDPDGWEQATGLHIARRRSDAMDQGGARLFADGLTSWVIRTSSGATDLLVFDRPAGSERDLVVLSEATGATVVQRHPSGVVRVVGPMGVLRWDGMGWHHEPPVAGWIDELNVCAGGPCSDVLERLLTFAVHDLGARGIGALLLHGADDASASALEARLATPPPLRIDEATDLAPLRHVLAQIDGAAVFDATGTLQQLGVRLVPSAEAERSVEGYRGMRHTAARRYSFDDPQSTVIAVSEDGPVTVLRGGEILGRTNPT